ncbi:hypothetical protein TREMEDRAFT_61521 [Tremella mesenterica DSM 1558]|uniref:uncharacterized protein n=1 Tax=Tremella mesenterica (strain ATCC 24925 / CBS 8224 / DSM 1558 / NBRC 9311 / NRRL Y-6157 / RJB 2259-6 / UBC 559-6) TaxID=578456 RepID=UPI0003F49609|nr:uncharacterized protein TREMEDRAFT_61521 [Tremella mesenterica DSM 1558]EIW69757.1 hypothetical protein TREMEDRAFT_61521 [Tremella mesenterica DSM 1558]
MSDIQSMTTAQSLSPSEVTQWCLSHGRTVDLDGKREKFHNYLSQAKSFLADETLFANNSSLGTELANVYQSARSNLISTLDKYASGAADKAFSYHAHAHGEEDCDALDNKTGCGIGEVFIHELSQNLGNLLLSKIHDNYDTAHDTRVDCTASTTVESKHGSDSEIDASSEATEVNGDQMFLSFLAKAYSTITKATNSIHTGPIQVFRKDIKELSGRKLDAVSTAMKTIEGSINRETPREIIEQALEGYSPRPEALGLTGEDLDDGDTDSYADWLHWGRRGVERLTELGFEDGETQVKAVRSAMSRIELSTWGMVNMTRNSISQPFDRCDVLSLRKLTEEICEVITTGWRIKAEDKAED